MRSTLFWILVLLNWAELVRADGLVCAGSGEDAEPIAPPAAAKLAQRLHEGTRSVIVIFAGYAPIRLRRSPDRNRASISSSDTRLVSGTKRLTRTMPSTQQMPKKKNRFEPP